MCLHRLRTPTRAEQATLSTAIDEVLARIQESPMTIDQRAHSVLALVLTNSGNLENQVRLIRDALEAAVLCDRQTRDVRRADDPTTPE